MKRLMSGFFPSELRNRGLAGMTYARVRACAGRLTLALTMVCFVSACSAEDHAATSTSVAQRSSAASGPEANTMKIRLTINGKSMTATLIDNPTARDFIALLPMTLKLEDYTSTEKIAYLPKKLSTQGAPAGVDPDVGDITYYAPWGNLAIFYRDFGYSTGLIKLGRFDAGIEALYVRGSLNVTLEAIGK
jgi:hypothetical protein